MDVHLLTIGFARRAAPYKRGDLLFDDVGRLKRILAGAGRFQVVYAGKAHPRDQGGKDVIRRICQAREALKGVPSLSVLDGWWIEGHIEGLTGWAIGEPAGQAEAADRRSKDASALY